MTIHLNTVRTPHPTFSLTLQVTRDCNLRCAYCYAGAKTAHAMTDDIAHAAIHRALNSLTPTGHLELGFFGGEPLLQSPFILQTIDHTLAAAGARSVAFFLTTNATANSGPAWDVLTHPSVRVTLSCDGPPEIHDRFRPTHSGTPSSRSVFRTIERLLAHNKDFSVIMVVRPQTLAALPDSIRFLRSLGVRRLQPSLDLWSPWTASDIARLPNVISECADLWLAGLPDYAISWFDDKLAGIARLVPPECVRCGFGVAELAVTPAGHLYPCERLIADDTADNPTRLPGHVLDAAPDFLSIHPAPPRTDHACSQCTMAAHCNTFCRCANFVRTGDTSKPDGLLCTWNQSCLAEVERRLTPRENNVLELAPGRHRSRIPLPVSN